ncbi:helix-turn-helix transcriptional regulator [Comamonas sp. w2-DMI]|uniref:helix-turn-helix transcriptional regulator n=1 Tax=Comamonas sp. w2-DMI TaxID=3126391 RepID=UPI0032E40FFC
MPRQNTPPADYPQAVLQQIEQLAQNIVIARKRRGESQAQWARKLGISQPTMARIERGDPSVAMASYVMCMWLINQAGGLADLIAPQNDHAALEKEVAKVRAKRKPAAKPAHAAKPAPLPPVAFGKPQALVSTPANTSPAGAGLAALLAGSKPNKK